MKQFSLTSLSKEQRALRRRIIEVSYKANFSHIGSCLSAVDLINGVYNIKDKDDLFVLSNGHAGVALYAVLEMHKYIIDIKTIYTLGVHPDRNPSINIAVSTGSLGHGLPIAAGMALADRTKRIFCMISDGECSEGSIWETINFARSYNLKNLVIIVNANGWGAYDPINLSILIKKFQGFGVIPIRINGHDRKKIDIVLRQKNNKNISVIFAQTVSDQLPFLKGQHAHYYVMNNNDYKNAMTLLR